ncbi:MAG: hypothetical protein GY842_26025 [bacterium]|nr:hypothetical protein [bacterium]
MNDQQIPPGLLLGISISDSPDLGRLGMGKAHLNEAMIEIARHLLRFGVSLAYGGDLRPGGFTRALFELVRSYRRDAPETLPVTNYLAWPVHRRWTESQLAELKEEFDGGGRLVLLDMEGKPLSEKLRQERLATFEQAPDLGSREWAEGLTAMRRTMTHECSARLLLGGQVRGYKGAAPGLAEEALEMLHARKPLYLAGGFGGCARDVIAALGYAKDWAERQANEIGAGYREIIIALRECSVAGLNNGLSTEENAILFETTSVPQILKYMLKGFVALDRQPLADAD